MVIQNKANAVVSQQAGLFHRRTIFSKPISRPALAGVFQMVEKSSVRFEKQYVASHRLSSF